MTELAQRLATRFHREALAVPRLSAGETIENGMVRLHRYVDYIKVTDLTNAGKRGKKVDVAHIRPKFDFRKPPADRDEAFRRLALLIEDYDQFASIISTVNDLNRDYPDAYEIDRHVERGVDVMPAGFKTVKLKTPFIEIEANFRDFRIQNVHDQDNLPTCIPAIEGGLSSIPVFYRWVTDNAESIRHMRYHAVLTEMQKLGIKYHDYCAID